MLARKLIAFGAQAGDDPLGIHQRLGAPKRNKADFGRVGLLHVQKCLIDGLELVPFARKYKGLPRRLAWVMHALPGYE
jgi:hypothetical protein